MAEKQPGFNPEHISFPSIEKEPSKRLERNSNERETTKETQPNIESIREQIAEKAISGKELTPTENEQPQPQSLFSTKQLKLEAFTKTMQRVRSRLNPPERALSKFMHHPTVEMLSNYGSETVARPSGILGGGLFTLVGSSVFLFYAKNRGFEYNYSIFILLFVAGFGAGLVTELIAKLLTKKRS